MQLVSFFSGMVTLSYGRHISAFLVRPVRREYTMSHLAPFVAAEIRDQVFEDLREENQRLREENQRLAAELKAAMVVPVTITGLGGEPVYVSIDLSKGPTVDRTDLIFQFDKDDDGANTCCSNILTLYDLRNLEIYVGGILVCESQSDLEIGHTVYESSPDRMTHTVGALKMILRTCRIDLEILDGGIIVEGDQSRYSSFVSFLLWFDRIICKYCDARVRIKKITLLTHYFPGLLSRVEVDPINVDPTNPEA